MSKRTQYTQNNGRLLGDKAPCIYFNSRLHKAIKRAPAILLQKLHYWLTTQGSHIGEIIEGRRWIYNTYLGWVDTLGIYSETTIYRAFNELEDLGIVSSRKPNASKGDHTKWYTINYDVLEEQFSWLFREEEKQEIASDDVDNQNLKTLEENPQEEAINPYSSRSRHFDEIIYKDKQRNNLISSISSSLFSKKLIGKAKYRKRAEKKEEKKESKTTSTNQVIYQMQKIWNEVVEEGQNNLVLTKQLCKWLLSALNQCFKGNMENWKNYCLRITSSDFLMGRTHCKFKAWLTWSLKFENIQKIMQGCYGAKEPFVQKPLETPELKQQKIQVIENSLEGDVVKAFRANALSTLGVNTYASWFEEINVSSQGNVITLHTNSRFRKDYIDTHFSSKLSAIVHTVCPDYQLELAA